MYGDQASIETLEISISEQAVNVAAVRDGLVLHAEALATLAAADPSLEAFAGRLSQLVDDYDALVARHHEAASKESGGFFSRIPLIRWVGSDRYRSLHRINGALIAEHRVLADRSESLRSDLQHFVADTIVPESHEEVGRYQVAPPHYRRMEYRAQHQELGDIIASIDTAP